MKNVEAVAHMLQVEPVLYAQFADTARPVVDIGDGGKFFSVDLLADNAL
jgi:hypothetical protein